MSMDKHQPLGIGWPEWITGLAMWLIAGILIFTTNDMPFWIEQSPGPRLLPILIAVCMAILAVLYWIESYRAGRGIQFPGLGQLKRPAGFIALSFLIYFLWEVLGAVPTLLVVGFLELKLMEGHSWLRSFLAASAMCLFAWVVFQMILEIPLPLGVFN
jgi:hypothetical protein